MIDWKKHPKAAYADVTFFDEHHCDIGSQLDISRPTNKTVADAVKAFGGEWSFSDCYKELWMCNPKAKDGATCQLTDDHKLICTREQFEACAAKKGEKWTHTYGHAGYKCKVISVNGEHSWILTENGDKLTEYTSSLKPIKPKLTKAQAWDKMKSLSRGGISYAYARIVDEHNITD